MFPIPLEPWRALKSKASKIFQKTVKNLSGRQGFKLKIIDTLYHKNLSRKKPSFCKIAGKEALQKIAKRKNTPKKHSRINDAFLKFYRAK